MSVVRAVYAQLKIQIFIQQRDLFLSVDCIVVQYNGSYNGIKVNHIYLYIC